MRSEVRTLYRPPCNLIAEGKMPARRKKLSTKQVKRSDLWYLIGLITSDGSLSKDGRHIDITSKDYGFLNNVKNLIGLRGKVTAKSGGKNQKAFHIQVSNRNFYDFLLSIGLMPRKSLTLKEVKVPDIYFVDFLRGLIDGDGGIQRWIHHTNRREQWNLRVASGSKKFLERLQNKIEKKIKVQGRLHIESPTRIRLKYGKMAGRVIAQKCYYKGCFGLQRKSILAKECIDSYKGWSKSKTVNY